LSLVVAQAVDVPARGEAGGADSDSDDGPDHFPRTFFTSSATFDGSSST
jgi:hypothetical protein